MTNKNSNLMNYPLPTDTPGQPSPPREAGTLSLVTVATGAWRWNTRTHARTPLHVPCCPSALRLPIRNDKHTFVLYLYKLMMLGSMTRFFFFKKIFTIG